MMSPFKIWDALTWTLVLAIVPYGWTVVGALLMCWMVVQLDKRNDKSKYYEVGGRVNLYHDGTKTYQTGQENEGTTIIYGGISPRYPDRDETENRQIWKDFYNNDDF